MAEDFFTKLQSASIRRVVDTRLNNRNQLAGFSKRRDLEYFLRTIAGVDYVHDLDLAPTAAILKPYKNESPDVGRLRLELNATGREKHAC